MKCINITDVHFSKSDEINFLYKKTIFFINLAGIMSFPLFYVAFFYAAKFFFPGKTPDIMVYLKAFRDIPVESGFVLVVILFFITIFHEGIHGLFFYLFTGDKPVFGYKKLSAYAGAPNWYIKKNYYQLVILSPFFVITILSFFVWALSSGTLNILMFIAASAHAAGCVGDLWVSLILIKRRPETYVNDNGMSLKISAL